MDLGVPLNADNAPVAMVLQTYSRNPAGKHQIYYEPMRVTEAPAHFVKVSAIPNGDHWEIWTAPYDPAGNPLPGRRKVDL